jgi:hypothetical protein
MTGVCLKYIYWFNIICQFSKNIINTILNVNTYKYTLKDSVETGKQHTYSLNFKNLQIDWKTCVFFLVIKFDTAFFNFFTDPRRHSDHRVETYRDVTDRRKHCGRLRFHVPTFFSGDLAKNDQLRVLSKFKVSRHQVVIQSDACI